VQRKTVDNAVLVCIFLLFFIIVYFYGCIIRRPCPTKEGSSSKFYDYDMSLWLIGTVRAEPETVISRAWVQSPDPAE